MIEVIYGLEAFYDNPPANKDIDGYVLKSNGEKFKRVEIPDWFDDLEYDEDDNPIYEDKHIDFIKREWDRVMNGYWFFNKGIPTYMIGGVIAHHPYLKNLLNEKFDKNIEVIESPQHVVSYGAAIIAMQQFKKSATVKEKVKAIKE